MKCFGILVALSLMCMVSARPQNGMFFYQQQQQQPGYYQRQPTAHRMYVQYQPYKSNRRSADVGSGLSAYAAGNTVAAGTYLRQTEINDDFEAGVPQQDGTISVAEAYPEAETSFAQNDQVDQIDQSVQADEPQYNDETPIAEDAIPEVEVTVTKKKTGKEFTPVAPAVEDTPSADEVEQDAAVVPAKSPAKKKKVRVQLEEAEDDDDEDDDTAFVPYNTKSNRGGSPINTFFPVHFGKTSGGAIAVANSFSTGKGGTATSHATAYGSSSKKSKSKNRAAEE